MHRILRFWATATKSSSMSDGHLAEAIESAPPTMPQHLWVDPLRARRHVHVFSAAQPHQSKMMVGIVLGGGLAGAGTYATWITETDAVWRSYAPLAVVVGAIVAAAIILMVRAVPDPVRIGAGGIGRVNASGIEERIPWSDIETVLWNADALTVEGAGHRLVLPGATMASAVRAFLSEYERRWPTREHDWKIEAGRETGTHEALVLDPIQVAGQSCRASGKRITVDQDAVQCRYCEALYLRAELPMACTVCGAKT